MTHILLERKAGGSMAEMTAEDPAKSVVDWSAIETKAKHAWSLWKPTEAGEDHSQSLPGQHDHANILVCDSLASRTVREYISIVLSHQVWGNLLQQPSQTDIKGYRKQ